MPLPSKEETTYRVLRTFTTKKMLKPRPGSGLHGQNLVLTVLFVPIQLYIDSGT